MTTTKPTRGSIKANFMGIEPKKFAVQSNKMKFELSLAYGKGTSVVLPWKKEAPSAGWGGPSPQARAELGGGRV